MEYDETTLLIKMGGRIAFIRKKKKLTQSRLAQKCGFEKASMSRIEAGRANPTMRTLFKISRALDIPVTELCDDLV